jgi:hypothetical protein
MKSLKPQKTTELELINVEISFVSCSQKEVSVVDKVSQSMGPGTMQIKSCGAIKLHFFCSA